TPAARTAAGPGRRSATPAAQQLQGLADSAERGRRRQQAAGRRQDDVLQEVGRALDALDRLRDQPVEPAGLPGREVRDLGEVLARPLQLRQSGLEVTPHAVGERVE